MPFKCCWNALPLMWCLERLVHEQSVGFGLLSPITCLWLASFPSLGHLRARNIQCFLKMNCTSTTITFSWRVPPKDSIEFNTSFCRCVYTTVLSQFHVFGHDLQQFSGYPASLYFLHRFFVDCHCFGTTSDMAWGGLKGSATSTFVTSRSSSMAQQPVERKT